MTLLLWALQAVLALLYLAGGGFKAFNPDDVAKQITTIPRPGWVALGVIEVLGGVLLIVPAALNWMPALTPLAATVLAVETLALAAVYASHSRKLTASNPLVFALPMGLVAAFVAYGRYVLVPLG